MRVQVKAQHKMARISPQKARLVADQIRNKPVAEAMQLLSFSNKKAATLLLQVLRSAIANAVHNEGVDGRRLAVVLVMIDEAKTFKRFRARARGRANQILKRTSHIMIAVGY